jgi:hypothetical protein
VKSTLPEFHCKWPDLKKKLWMHLTKYTELDSFSRKTPNTLFWIATHSLENTGLCIRETYGKSERHLEDLNCLVWWSWRLLYCGNALPGLSPKVSVECTASIIKYLHDGKSRSLWKCHAYEYIYQNTWHYISKGTYHMRDIFSLRWARLFKDLWSVDEVWYRGELKIW